MNWADSLLGFIHEYEPLILLALSALVVILITWTLCLAIRLGKLRKAIVSAATPGEKPSESTNDLAQKLDDSSQQIDVLTKRHEDLDNRLAGAVQRYGIVRYNAFPDIGGEQSFTLALLDRDMNGIVLSSLYGRTDSRVYAKEITKGQSQHALSDEEMEAIRRAGTQPR